LEAKRHGLKAALEISSTGIPAALAGRFAHERAGAMGKCDVDVVESVRLMDFAGMCCELAPKEIAR